MLKDNPADNTLLEDSVDRYRKVFHKPPLAVSTDRGFYSKDNEEMLRIRGLYIATGMHGGAVYIRGGVNKNQLGKDVAVEEVGDEEKTALKGDIEAFCRYFGVTENPNTVARAYQEMERLGLTETRRGRGTFVALSPPKRQLRELAHGQRTLAALVFVLSHHPSYLFPDEPTAGLDPLRNRGGK